jgi:Zeta toxin
VGTLQLAPKPTCRRCRLIEIDRELRVQHRWSRSCVRLKCVADVVFLVGTVGAGKTTVADALSDLERRYRRPHAGIDLDQLRRLWPSAESDPFHLALELENLASWP